MIDPNNVPPITDEEMLARFITQAKQFRPSDQSVKPDLFIPFRQTELSVTRHRDATLDELWQLGRDVAGLRQQVLYGRSDVRAVDCRVGPLVVVPDPIVPPDQPTNPNHANVRGFPSSKEDQKALAIKIAHRASKRIAPPEPS